MSTHDAVVEWRRGDQPFLDKRYSRRHDWLFDGGALVKASSGPQSVPTPMSDPSAVDPEEAMVASLSSCHMLWFLAFAADAGLIVDHYHDEPYGELDRDSAGRRYMARVMLRPLTVFSGQKPDQAELDALHHRAHQNCDMASSVRTEITIQAEIG